MRFTVATTALILSVKEQLAANGQLLLDGQGLFSYNNMNDNGPQFWDIIDTSPDVNACGGNRQSPVGFSADDSLNCDTENAPYVFNGGTCTLDQLIYYNNDHSVEAEYPEDGSCEPSTFSIPEIDGVFEITQFHTHTGSEHTLEGVNADFELHCVHKLKSGTGTQSETDITNTQAVVGMWIVGEGDTDNAMFESVLAGWRAYYEAEQARCAGDTARRLKATEEYHRSLQAFNVYSLLDDTGTDRFFHYQGSLTTPACTEDLWWNVASKPVIISEAQRDELGEIILGYLDDNCTLATGADPDTKQTSRPLQPLNGRTVLTYCTGSDESPTAPTGPTEAPAPTPTNAPTSSAFSFGIGMAAVSSMFAVFGMFVN